MWKNISVPWCGNVTITCYDGPGSVITIFIISFYKHFPIWFNIKIPPFSNLFFLWISNSTLNLKNFYNIHLLYIYFFIQFLPFSYSNYCVSKKHCHWTALSLFKKNTCVFFWPIFTYLNAWLTTRRVKSHDDLKISFAGS